MFIWIGVAVVAAISLAVAVHKAIALKLLASYYEAEVLEHNGRECYTERSYYSGTRHEYRSWNIYNWERKTVEEKERKIHECAKKRALAQSKHWIRTELNDWSDRMIIKAAERKEARINGVIDPLRGKMQQALEDKRRVEAIVQELRNEPELTDLQKYELVYNHFVDTAHESK